MRVPSARDLALTASWLVFAAVCVLPPVYMFGRSLGAGGSFTTEAYSALVADARQRQLFWNSLALGSGTAALATALGVFLGLILARVPSARIRVVRVLLCVPLAVPSYVLATAWMLATGAWLFTVPGAVFVLGFNLYPLAMLATEAAARRIETPLEEAAVLAASPRRVLTHVTLPLIAPAISAAALMILVIALSDFGVPALLRLRVYTT